MGKINVFENISLDGYFAGPNGEIDWFVSHPCNKEEDEYAIDSAKSTGTLLFGRVTYELMASYWPTAAAMKNSPRLAERMNNIPKIVFSRTLDKVEWNNTRLLRENIEKRNREDEKSIQKRHDDTWQWQYCFRIYATWLDRRI